MTDLGQDYGDFVNLDDECEVEDDSEPRNHYCRRYSYPVYIGEVLGEWYRIEHKLGWGGYSRIWLTQDTTYTPDILRKQRSILK